MGKITKLGVILFAITMITGVILGGVHTMTLKPIAETQLKEKNEALAATLPEATTFKMLKIATNPNGHIKEINVGSDGSKLIGYNITVTPKGYGGSIEMIVGVKADGTLSDIQILNHGETPGLGAKAPEPEFAGQFKNKKVTELEVVKTEASADNQIQAISGATITSKAVTSGVNEALKYVHENLCDGGAQ